MFMSFTLHWCWVGAQTHLTDLPGLFDESGGPGPWLRSRFLAWLTTFGVGGAGLQSAAFFGWTGANGR